MKKNLLLRLCLTMIALLSLHSCQQDLLPEKETYNNSSAFQLTSKRISLNESKHKAKLLPELEKAEVKFKAFSKTNTQGKTVNYGNGVSIDTDDVTYIENGPNYHTYTFNIKRENVPADAPVENLVLSPLTDGTYRELLFSYNLTLQEKQTLMNGGFVDTKNKVTVTDLQKGTFNSGGQLAKNTVCTWTIDTHYTTCSEGLHSHGETAGSGEPGTGTCNAETLSQLVVLVVGDCKAIGDDGIPGGGSTSPGTTSPGGLGGGTDDGSGNTDFPSNEPGNCNGGLTAPQTPNYDISDGGCGSSIPTQPNLPIKDKTPCAKTKAMLQRPNVQQGITNVKAQALQTLSNMNTGETGFKEKKDGTTAPADVNSAHQVVFNDVTDSYGGYHNHTATGTHMFSPPDIDALFGFAAAQSIQDGVGNAYLGMIAAEWCSTCPNNVQYIHYVIQFAGTGTELGGYVYSPAQMKQFEKDYLKTVRNLKNTNINGNTYIKNAAGDLNEKGLEKLFFDTLKSMNLNGKVNLQRIENGIVNNVTLDSNSMPTGTPCP